MNGERDVEAAVGELAAALPGALQPLARIAYDYRWSWAADGAAVFAAIDPERWERCGCNPRRLLAEVPRAALARAAADPSYVERAARLGAELAAERARPARADLVDPAHPVAFYCAEFAIHASLPLYAGGLGVLAGDILKAACDLALPFVGVGLMYRAGYFHQRIDTSGLQLEYWVDADPELLPCVRVTGADGAPLTVSVPIGDETVRARVWRVDVGRVPLYLLDTDVPGNSQVGRWVTSRLYESNRAIRLAQYAVLGVGGARALRSLGIEPSVHHLNEGHAALAACELLARAQAQAAPDTAWQQMRSRIAFTTHTPVAAGNEGYPAGEFLATLGPVADLIGARGRLPSIGRVDPSNGESPVLLTAIALRTSSRAIGVSRRHGEVARAMWQPLFPGRAVHEVPIAHVTNGVHLPSWLCAPMRELLDRHLGERWLARADERATWEPVRDIPSAELWSARCAARRQLVERVARQATAERLRRGEPIAYAEATVDGFDPARLTIGFARRLALYKRLHLVALLPQRSLALLGGEHPVQFVFAGKAHPDDGAAKDIVRQVFALKHAPAVAGRAAFLEDYDLALAARLVGGCDVWVNLPRPPNEASGTSGMKACINGVLHLSVRDGWWDEAWAEGNGWAIGGDVDADTAAQDRRDAGALLDLLQYTVVPMFHERDADGVPQQWVAMMRRSLMEHGPRVAATRMVREYVDRLYRGR